MPADLMEKSGPSPAPPGRCSPDKPRTSEHRRSSKPIMEKRRRARINESLGQLKTLILDALKKDSSRHSKLEKADILEMTVKHLRGLQRAHLTAALTSDPSVLGRYRAGFSECTNEVTRFLSTCEGVTPDARTRLQGHLAGCMTQINALSPQGPFGQAPPAGAPCKPGPPALDSAQLFGGFQIVPASDGHFAFLIPSAAFAHGGPAVPAYPGTGVPASVSPGAPTLTADSVWRPW
ncbi:transcription factor HES-1 [Lissotriton helveticus]